MLLMIFLTIVAVITDDRLEGFYMFLYWAVVGCYLMLLMVVNGNL